jgi:hypothetical protein
MPRDMLSNALGLLGTLLGGAVGFVVFRWIAGQGFYAPFVVGGLSGLGCMALARHSSPGRGVICGVLAVVIEVIAEGMVFPFVRDDRLAYFLTHLHWLPPVKLVMIALGGLLAGYLGREHVGGSRARRAAS